jgi:hypothetical protein
VDDWEPTAPQRNQIEALAGYGLPEEDIARLFQGCSAESLRLRCLEELHRGAAKANAKVAETIYTQAISGQNIAASIFWAETRLGWRRRAGAKPDQGDPAAPWTPPVKRRGKKAS